MVNVTFDGAIFWVGYNFSSCYYLVSFDIATESFTLIPIPSSAHVFSSTPLSVYENKVAMLCDHRDESRPFSLDLWVMEKCIDESGERWIWSKIFTNSTTIGDFLSPPSTLWTHEFYFWQPCSGPFILVKVVGRTDRAVETSLVFCNFHTNQLKTFATSKFGIRFGRVWNYAESLVSPGNIQMEASSS